MPSDSGKTSPSGFEDLILGSSRAWVRPGAREWVRASVLRHGSIYQAARSQADGHSELRGRAPVFLVSVNDDSWAVRHYVRGGAVASVLGDRYLRAGVPRPFRETRASEHLRTAEIPTPPVVAAVQYPAGLFYRGDLVTEYIPGSHDLSQILFANRSSWEDELRVEALERAGSLIGRLGKVGILHPDLNVKNLLMQPDSNGMRAHLIDLDGCRPAGRRSVAGLVDAMERRILRSIRKWERRSGQVLSEAERAALKRGIDATC